MSIFLKYICEFGWQRLALGRCGGDVNIYFERCTLCRQARARTEFVRRGALVRNNSFGARTHTRELRHTRPFRKLNNTKRRETGLHIHSATASRTSPAPRVSFHRGHVSHLCAPVSAYVSARAHASRRGIVCVPKPLFTVNRTV